MKNKIKYHTVGTVPKSNQKIIETKAKAIPLAHIHNHSLSWLDTGTLIKSG
jgi:hypothetical protein